MPEYANACTLSVALIQSNNLTKNSLVGYRFLKKATYIVQIRLQIRILKTTYSTKLVVKLLIEKQT